MKKSSNDWKKRFGRGCLPALVAVLLPAYGFALSRPPPEASSFSALTPYATTNSGFVIRSDRLLDAQTYGDMAVFLRDRIDILLCASNDAVTQDAVLIFDKNVWDAVICRDQRRPDAVGLHGSASLMVLASEDRLETALRLAHELAHRRLQAARPGLPLWLEEGTAGHIGWNAARQYARARGADISRPAVRREEGTAWTLEYMTGLKDYPENAAESAAFYRMTEEFVRWYRARAGDAAFCELLDESARDGSAWQKLLLKRMSLNDIAEFESNWRKSEIGEQE